MGKLEHIHSDLSAIFASLTTFALVLIIGAFVSGLFSGLSSGLFSGLFSDVVSTPAHARAWAPLDVTWTQTLQDEVKVLGERFTGHSGDHPDLIAAQCGRTARDTGASHCPRH